MSDEPRRLSSLPGYPRENRKPAKALCRRGNAAGSASVLVIFGGLLHPSFHGGVYDDASTVATKSASPSGGGGSGAANTAKAPSIGLDAFLRAEIDLSVPEKIPLSTIARAGFPAALFGASGVDAFLGKWEDVPKNDFLVRGDKTICPDVAKERNRHNEKSKFLCKTYHGGFKEYAAPGLRRFNASHFAEITERKGPIVFVGDSLMGQMFKALRCRMEAETGSSEINIVKSDHPLIRLSPEDLEYIELRYLPVNESIYDQHLDPSFAELATSINASYVVFNTGAHWNKLRWRGEWCDWDRWDDLGHSATMNAFERAFRDVLLPLFWRLRDRGIVTVWRDVSPGGLWDESLGDIAPNEYADFYHNFPVFNRIGRKYVAEAGGLILPVFDLSMSRWQEHVQLDAFRGQTVSDNLHWCALHSKDTVPSVWVQLLYNVIFDDLAGPPTNVVSRSTSSSHKRAEKRNNNTIAHDLAKRKEKVVPHSKSSDSACPCSVARSYVQCRSNVRCVWLVKSVNQTGSGAVTMVRQCAEKNTNRTLQALNNRKKFNAKNPDDDDNNRKAAAGG